MDRRRRPGSMNASASAPSLLAKLGNRFLQMRPEEKSPFALEASKDVLTPSSQSSPQKHAFSASPHSPSARAKSRKQSHKATAAAVEDALAQYAVLTKDNTWQQIGREEHPLEKPASRREIARLDSRFTRAMDISSAKILGNNPSARLAEVSPMDARMEQDIVTLREEVASEFRSITPAGRSPRPEHHEAQTNIISARFEQKWCDLVLGELQKQVSVGCLQHGNLIRKVRSALATSFLKMKCGNSRAMDELASSRGEIRRLEENLDELNAQKETIKEQLREENEEKVRQERAKAEEKYAEYEDKLEDEKEARRKLVESLATLNAMFRDMQNDADMMRALDKKDAIIVLERNLKSAHEELQELRPLAAQIEETSDRVARQAEHINELKDALNEAKSDIEKRDALIDVYKEKVSVSIDALEDGAEAMGAIKLADAEIKAADTTPKESAGNSHGGVLTDDVAQAKQAGESPGTSTPDPTENAHVSEASKIRSGMDGPNSSQTILCARCNSRLDEVGNIDDILEDSETQQQPCAGYRMLLPNLLGYRPEKDKRWILRNVRCILSAKRRDDLAAVRDGRLKHRFPEFVYAWFTPEYDEDLSAEAWKAATAQADENRWALYYGLKGIIDDVPEARLFYSFLAEKLLDNDAAFYFHCLSIIEGIVNSDPRSESPICWGVYSTAASFEQVESMQEEAGGEDEVPDYLWIEVRHAGAAVKKVMAKSSDDDIKRALKQLAEAALESKVSIVAQSGSKMIDLSTVIKLLMREYGKEQSHRRAAVRMMFETCKGGGGEENREVDLPQLEQIVNVLDEEADAMTAPSLYRMACEFGKGKLTYRSFMKAAQRMQFLTKCLRLPPHYGSESVAGISEQEQRGILDAVRLSWALNKDFVYETMQSGGALDAEIGALEDLLEEMKGSGSGNDAIRALCCIRRIYRALLLHRFNDRELSGEPAEMENKGNLVQKELVAYVSVLRDFKPNVARDALDKAKTIACARKMQRRWRNFVVFNPIVGVPRGVRQTVLSKKFDPRVLVTSGRSKRLPRNPAWGLDLVLRTIEAVYAQVVMRSSSIAASVFRLMMMNFPVRVIAERLVHDFFVNVHRFAGKHPRVKLFARFAGAHSKALIKNTESKADMAEEPLDAYFPPALGNVAALKTYLSFLVALQASSASKKKGASTTTLFSQDEISTQAAKTALALVFKGAKKTRSPCDSVPLKAALDEAHVRLKARARKGKIELDAATLILLQCWLSERTQRVRAIDHIASDLQRHPVHEGSEDGPGIGALLVMKSGEDANGGGDGDANDEAPGLEAVVSFSEFESTVLPRLYGGKMPREDKLNIYLDIVGEETHQPLSAKRLLATLAPLNWSPAWYPKPPLKKAAPLELSTSAWRFEILSSQWSSMVHAIKKIVSDAFTEREKRIDGYSDLMTDFSTLKTRIAKLESAMAGAKMLDETQRPVDALASEFGKVLHAVQIIRACDDLAPFPIPDVHDAAMEAMK